MPEDMLVLVDELGRTQGFMEKQQAHLEARLHLAFSVFLYKDGKMLLQQRARAKYHCGGLWANACCSHPRKGESPAQAVPRRLAQELGITAPVAAEEIFRFVYRAPFDNGLTEHELDHVFIGRYDGPVRPDPAEIEAVEWVSFEELRRDLAERPQRYCPWFLACAPKVLAILLQEEPLPVAGRPGGEELAWRYPQLGLAVEKGAAESAAYKSLVRKGLLPNQAPAPFLGEVHLVHFATPAGLVELAWLPNRLDFTLFAQVMCHRCEPVPIPATMGAVSVFGVNGWRRIQHHRALFEARGHTGWPAEFKRFTQNKANYQDTLLAVTDGPYSGLSGENAGVEAAAWRQISLRIRIYHELAHFISRRLYAQNRQALRDEVLADCVGLLAATGRYEQALAKRLLGIEGGAYRKGGRLENYLEKEEAPDESALKAAAMVEAFAAAYARFGKPAPFAFLLRAEEECVGL
ncbi:MAG: isopentenyl-diphosphate Delta-isomerase [Oscillospiraceae bacterium]